MGCAVMESVGTREVAILVALAILPAALFIASLVEDTPRILQIVLGCIAIPMCFPWIAHLLALLFSELMPSTVRARAPAAGGLRLSTHEAVAFRRSPIKNRLLRIYVINTLHAIPALLIVVLAIGLIHFVVTSR